MVDSNIVGISPSGVGEVVNSLQRRVNDAQRLITSYRAQFTSAGVATGNVDAAYRTLGWGIDQLPMLRRRLSLAQHIDDGVGNPFGRLGLPRDMVSTGAGNIALPDDAAAAAAGRADGARLKTAMGKGPLTPDLEQVRPLLEQVRANSGDPAYCDALIKLLGPEAIGRLSHMGFELQHHKDAKGAELVFSSTGAALATASSRIPNVDSWLDKMTIPTAERQPTTLVARFLKYGNYDAAFLERVGVRELAVAVEEPDAERSKAIWSAIARDPKAASLLYNLDLTKIMQYANEGRGNFPQSNEEMTAFSAVTRAATIGAYKDFPGMADQNIEAIIHYFGDHPDYHTADPIRDAHADMIVSRWSDLVYSFSSPFSGTTESAAGDNPMRLGAEVPPKMWKNFVTDTMRHGSAAAELLKKTEDWADKIRQGIAGKRWPNNHAGKTPDGQMPNYWDNIVLGQVKSLIKGSGVEALQQLKKDDEAKAKQWVGVGEAAIGEALKNKADAAQYFKDLGGALAGNMKQKFDTWAENYIKEHYGDKDVKAVAGLIDDYASDYRSDWEHQARDIWLQRTAHRYDNYDPVHYGGVSRDGDPTPYESKYHTKITYVDRGGHRRLLGLSEISRDWAKIQAYNEWLQDPAVANAVWQNSSGHGESG